MITGDLHDTSNVKTSKRVGLRLLPETENQVTCTHLDVRPVVYHIKYLVSNEITGVLQVHFQ